VSPAGFVSAAMLAWGPAPWPKPEVNGIAAKAPAVCRERPSRFDGDGQRLLLAFETQIANEVLGNTKHRDDNPLNTGEVHSLLTRFPQAEVAFAFPEPIAIPRSRFRARSSTTRVSYSRTAPVAFQVEISDLVMLRRGRRMALAFYFSSGPIGPPPGGGVWMWGMGGAFCAIPRADARWRIYPLGPTVIS
jgi:hypothetical protein